MLQLVDQVVRGVLAETNRALWARAQEGVAITTVFTGHTRGQWRKLKEIAKVTHLARQH